jgi:hypothetical protein
MRVNVRYVLNSVDDAISFYTEIGLHPVPGFAALSRENVKLYLNSPGTGGAGETMPDGTAFSRRMEQNSGRS